MIQFTRALARQLRAVLKRSVWAAAPRGTRPPVVLRAERDGLRVCAYDPEVTVEYRQPGQFAPEVLAVAAEVLDDCEGRTDATVTLANGGTDAVQARWEDKGVPQVKDYQARDVENLPELPELPAPWTALDNGLVKALADAAAIAPREHVRYALQRTLLRGQLGQVVSTDGAQLLAQSGFTFPWPEELLIPSVAAFGCKELPQDGSVTVGKTDTHVVVRVGPWTFWLWIDKDGRYPRTENVIPTLGKNVTTCRLAPEDAVFLVEALPRLPGDKDDHAPVTLDLNGQVVVRARGEGQEHATEVVLSRSSCSGPMVRLVGNRQHLARAVQLGLTEFNVVNADTAVVCQDARRTYLWMTLDKKGAVPPSADVLRIASVQEAQPARTPAQERRRTAMPAPTTNGQRNGHGAPRRDQDNGDTAPTNGGTGSPIEEAEALKDLLRGAYGRMTRLLAVLKRQRQQSKLLKSTLSSLRQLQAIET